MLDWRWIPAVMTSVAFGWSVFKVSRQQHDDMLLACIGETDHSFDAALIYPSRPE